MLFQSKYQAVFEFPSEFWINGKVYLFIVLGPVVLGIDVDL